MKKQLAVLLAAAALSACHARRAQPPAPAPAAALTDADLFRIRLSMPIRRAVAASDAPADLAEQATRTTKFLADSKAYDSGMRRIPADKLTTEDRSYIKHNEGWFQRDRESLDKLLKRLQAWVDASPTVSAAPEQAPQ